MSITVGFSFGSDVQFVLPHTMGLVCPGARWPFFRGQKETASTFQSAEKGLSKVQKKDLNASLLAAITNPRRSSFHVLLHSCSNCCATVCSHLSPVQCHPRQALGIHTIPWKGRRSGCLKLSLGKSVAKNGAPDLHIVIILKQVRSTTKHSVTN